MRKLSKVATRLLVGAAAVGLSMPFATGTGTPAAAEQFGSSQLSFNVTWGGAPPYLQADDGVCDDPDEAAHLTNPVYVQAIHIPENEPAFHFSLGQGADNYIVLGAGPVQILTSGLRCSDGVGNRVPFLANAYHGGTCCPTESVYGDIPLTNID